MQDSRAGSTLELVVNEQHIQNMSQIDLRPSPSEINQQTNARLNSYLAQAAGQQQQQTLGGNKMFSFKELRSWPTRLRLSIQTKLDEAKAKSETRLEYVFAVIQAFSSIVGWILCFLFTIVMPIVMFIIGLTTLDDCNERHSLPYLILTIGFVMTASNVFNLTLALDLPILSNHGTLSTDAKNIIASIVNIMLNCVVAFLYILTSYMVYNINGGTNKANINLDATNVEETGETQTQLQCNATLYSFAYWFITLTLGIFVIMTILGTLMFAYNRYRSAIIRGSTLRPPTAASNPSATNNGNVNMTQA